MARKKADNNRKLLKKQLAKESKMGQADSREVLHEFELLGYEEPGESPVNYKHINRRGKNTRRN